MHERQVDAGAALLARAGAGGSGSLAVVGVGKNAGKSVVVGALCTASTLAGVPFALCSIGRDGEATDAFDGAPKPRHFLRAGTLFATALALVPRSPAAEIVAVTPEISAIGPLVVARARAAGYVEIVGPPRASSLRRLVETLAARARFVLIDGAIDRIAALRGGDDAIVVAVGAANAPTLARAVEAAAALTERLALAAVDPSRPYIDVAGALTPSAATAFARAGERRQIVVADATHVAFGGRAYLDVAARLDLRCRRPMQPVACTVAPFAAERSFEPRAFARAVAERTALPTYDVFAGRAYGVDPL